MAKRWVYRRPSFVFFGHRRITGVTRALQDRGSGGGSTTVDWTLSGVVRMRVRNLSTADVRLQHRGSSLTVTYHERT